MPLSLQFADSSRLPVVGSVILGRGNPSCWQNGSVSREQVRLSPVEGVEDVVRIENLGLNQRWELTDLLDSGMQTLLSAHSRFFIASLNETVVTVNLEECGPSRHPPTQAERATKKARIEIEIDAATDPAEKGVTGARALATAAHILEYTWDSPMSLLWVRGLKPMFNEGCLGARLHNYLSGPIKLVLVSNYMIDLPWLLSACPTLKTAERLVIVHGEDAETEQAMQATFRSAGMSQQAVCHRPPLPIQWGTHHSKAFLVEYPAGVRVIVHTANLIYADCNSKTQGLWAQDFPPKSQGSAPTSPFEQDLSDYLRALKMPVAVGRQLADIVARHDFSSARVKLLSSVPGYHASPKLHSYGHMALRAALSKEVFPAEFRDAPALIQCSSLGSLDEKWLLSEFGATLTAGRFAGPTKGAPLQQGTLSASKLAIVWPTVEEVRNSLEGWAAGASVPGPEKNVGKPFLQRYWARYGGEPVGRQRAMPHIKTYCRYSGGKLPWFAVSSHNLSKAAWGTLQKNGTQLMIRSYELGVLMLPSLEAAYRAHPHCGFSCTATPQPGSSAAGGSDLSAPRVEFVALTDPAAQSSSCTMDAAGEQVRRVVLPLPYKLPPQPYGTGDRPWMCDVVFPGADSMGRTIGHPFSLYGHLEPGD